MDTPARRRNSQPMRLELAARLLEPAHSSVLCLILRKPAGRPLPTLSRSRSSTYRSAFMDAFSRPDRTHDPLRAARIVMLPAGIALMLALAGAAFAQGTGEADPAQAKARPSP